VPDNATCTTEFAPVVARERMPVAFPAVVGWNETEIVTDWLGINVMFDPALVPNPFVEVEMLAIVRLELPVFVKLMSCAVALPRVTVPKFKLVGVVESCAAVADEALPVVLVDPEGVFPFI
jgi:hypothetical protein